LQQVTLRSGSKLFELTTYYAELAWHKYIHTYTYFYKALATDTNRGARPRSLKIFGYCVPNRYPETFAGQTLKGASSTKQAHAKSGISGLCSWSLLASANISGNEFHS
jgi:hypothetical protein